MTVSKTATKGPSIGDAVREVVELQAGKDGSVHRFEVLMALTKAASDNTPAFYRVDGVVALDGIPDNQQARDDLPVALVWVLHHRYDGAQIKGCTMDKVG